MENFLQTVELLFSSQNLNVMKNILLIFFLSISFATLSFSSSNEIPEKRIEIDTYVTASNGCKFHVTGYVDVSFGWGGVSVDGYDITATGPCGDYHFEGLVAPPSGNNPNGEITPSQVKEIVTNIVNENIRG